MNEKIIFHIDVNSAFLSWSAAYRIKILGEKTDLREIPSVVGGDQESRHGIVLAKSTPAKKFKIQTGESIVTAREKCPKLVVVPPDYSLYVSASRALMELLEGYSDQVVEYSIDEAWVEFTGFENLYGGIVGFAGDLKNQIKEELGFTVNIGISNNYLLAKMAGELKKPDQVNTLFPWEIEKKMWKLPVKELFYVGRASEKVLHKLGIYTIGELASTDVELIKAHLKKQGEIIWNYAWGNDLMPYIYKLEPNKGYGNSMTAPKDIGCLENAKQILLSLCETIGIRLRTDNVQISCISVSITDCMFERNSRQIQLLYPTNVTEEIYKNACQVFIQLWDGFVYIRQIGVHTGKVQKERTRQYNMWDGNKYDKLEKLNQTVDGIREKYGEDSMMRACFLGSSITHMGGGLHKEIRSG